MTSHAQLLDAVRHSLMRARRHNSGDVVAPAAVLWPDADGQSQPVVEQLRGLMPELLTLGDNEPTTRTGPAIWLRCVIDPAVRADKFPDLVWPADIVPVIYIPGISRQTLRAVEECLDAVKPLVEQPICWEPDINDGARVNIRRFLASDLPAGRTGAGVLPYKPNAKWTEDRGREPERPKAEYPWFWGWDEKPIDFTGGKVFDGNRWNDCHCTNKTGHQAREQLAA